MLTYVINTSENKTFDSDLLFELSGYNKIRWMHCRLVHVEDCVKEISTRQNVLGAEAFRVVVLVDFYGFDRIRKPYGSGEEGYRADSGVDLCLYYPFVEVYLTDHLFAPLAKKNLSAKTYEVYYIQNERSDKIYSTIDNREAQLKYLFGQTDHIMDETEYAPRPAAGKEEIGPKVLLKEEEAPQQVELEEDLAARGMLPGDPARMSDHFDLYCTPDVTLRFTVADYPYGDGDRMLFEEFIRGFDNRVSTNLGVQRHLYVAEYGVGEAMAAFDTLALSLYLVRIYEREEPRTMLGEDVHLEIDHLDPYAVRDVLQHAWNKIHKAQEMTRENQFQYYSLDIDSAAKNTPEQPEEEEAFALAADATIPEEALKGSPRALFEQIRFISAGGDTFSEEDRKEIDEVIKQYLMQRDELREDTVQGEFAQLCAGGKAKEQAQCPSKLDHDMAVEKRHNKISEIFQHTLKAEYLATDYEEVYTRASKAYSQYQALDHRRSRCIIADVIMLLLTMVAMMTPYICLQRINADIFGTVLRAALIGAPLAGLFFLIFLCTVMIISSRIKRVQEELRECLRECLIKREYTLSALKQRYEQDLPQIEQLRYEVRGIGYLYEKNAEKLQNVRAHRQTLENVENRLSAILNNLVVEPVPDQRESLTGEFDIQKPIRSAANKVYRVFSVEAIEAMFQNKGGAGQ